MQSTLRQSASTGSIRRMPGEGLINASHGHSPWHTDVNYWSSLTRRQLMIAFSRMDRNGNGVLEFWEMQKLLHKRNPSMSTSELREAFKVADKDGDGALRFADFEEFMRLSACATRISLPRPQGITLRMSSPFPELQELDWPRKDTLQLPDLTHMNAKQLPDVAWSTVVPVPEEYWSRGAIIPQTEQRGITLQQITELASLVWQVVSKVVIQDPFTGFSRVTWLVANMYHVDPHFVRPLTVPFKCSFVELVAYGPQTPLWFVSHFWGTPFSQTVALLRFHAQKRGMYYGAPYWICTFANNQHDLSELGSSLQDTPFVKAILCSECQGTLTLMDHSATTLERIWCVLENFVSTKWASEKNASTPHLIDIATWLPYGSGMNGGQKVPAKATVRLDRGDGSMEELVDDPATGGAFPLTVSVRGSKIDVFKARASRAEDRKRILHLISGTPEEQWSEDPPTECNAYVEMNQNARRMFASGAFYVAALQGDMKELDRLTRAHKDLISTSLSDGATALYAAAWKNNVKAVQILLQARANVNARKTDGASPLFIAAQEGNAEIMTELIHARADVNVKSTEGVVTIFKAVSSGSSDAVEMLLEARAQPDVIHKGWTPLVLAADLGHFELAEILLENKANPDHCIKGVDDSPLGVAKKRGHWDIAGILMEAGATIESTAIRKKKKGARQGQPARGAFGHEFADAVANLSSTMPGGPLMTSAGGADPSLVMSQGSIAQLYSTI